MVNSQVERTRVQRADARATMANKGTHRFVNSGAGEQTKPSQDETTHRTRTGGLGRVALNARVGAHRERRELGKEAAAVAAGAVVAYVAAENR
jgi:hypothetical protein